MDDKHAIAALGALAQETRLALFRLLVTCGPAGLPRACLPAIPPMPLRQERAMKRLHVHVSIDDLAQSTRFYSTLFAAEPTVVKDDYVKWMLDDPRVNFAISTRPGRTAGISHLGVQAEDETELAEVFGRLSRA